MSRPQYGDEFEDEAGAPPRQTLDDVSVDDLPDAGADDDFPDDDFLDDVQPSGLGYRDTDEDDDPPAGEPSQGRDREGDLRDIMNGRPKKSRSRGVAGDGDRHGSFRYYCVPQAGDGKEMKQTEWEIIWGGDVMSDSQLQRELRARSDHACMWEVTKRVVQIVKKKKKLVDISTRTISTIGPEIEEDEDDDVTHEEHPYQDELEQYDDDDSDDDITIDEIVGGGADARPSGGSGNGRSSEFAAMTRLIEKQGRQNAQMVREFLVRRDDAPAREKVDWAERIESIAAIVAAAAPVLELLKPAPRETDLEAAAALIKTGVDISKGADAPDWKQMLGAMMMPMGQVAMQRMAQQQQQQQPGGGLLPHQQQQALPGPQPQQPQPQYIPQPQPVAGEPPRPAAAPQPTPQPAPQQPAAPQQPQQPQQPAQPQQAQIPPHLNPAGPPPAMLADKTSADHRKATLWRTMHGVAMTGNPRAMTEDYWASKIYVELEPDALTALVAAHDADAVALSSEGLESAPAVIGYMQAQFANLPPEDQPADEAAMRKSIAGGFHQFLGRIVEQIKTEYLAEEPTA